MYVFVISNIKCLVNFNIAILSNCGKPILDDRMRNGALRDDVCREVEAGQVSEIWIGSVDQERCETLQVLICGRYGDWKA
jgi:hypothetical protein